jgi:4-amino-4-deoxy-L-arabinose transferase-like glycosyltransferase
MPEGLPGRVLLVTILVTATVYWLWFGLTQRSIVSDEGISLLAAQGVLQHGYPRLPSGFLYNRAYVPTYLLAGSISLFGWSDLGIMLPSLLMALGSVWLTARIGADVLGRPRAGLAAAALLVMLQAQTFYATSARMYMPLQGFTMLATYAAWRGFVRGERRFQGLAGLAVAGAIFSHQQGGSLLVALPLAVLAARAMQGRERQAVSVIPLLIATAALWAGFYAATLYQPASRMISIADHGGTTPALAGLNLNLAQWAFHALTAESTIPLGILVVPWVGWLVVRAPLAPRLGAHQGLIFTAALFVLGAAAIFSTVHVIHWRFWLMLLPLQALLVAVGAAGLLEWMTSSMPGSRRRLLRWLALAAWVLAIVVSSTTTFGSDVYTKHLTKAYGRPYCVSGPCSADVRSALAKVQDALDPGDRVVTSNPWVAHYYLRRVDGFLRERRHAGHFVPFKGAIDEYFGIPLIDTPEELEALRTSTHRVWVVVDYKGLDFSSRSTLDFIATSFPTFLSDGGMTVYVNPSLPLSRAESDIRAAQ